MAGAGAGGVWTENAHRSAARERETVTRVSRAVNKTASTFVAGMLHGRVQVEMSSCVTYFS
jgi:hypothetical protein